MFSLLQSHMLFAAARDDRRKAGWDTVSAAAWLHDFNQGVKEPKMHVRRHRIGSGVKRAEDARKMAQDRFVMASVEKKN